MFSPIRTIQSTEVRRVDEVSPRKSVATRVPSPFAQTADGVRITIGADARRKADGQEDASLGGRETPSIPLAWGETELQTDSPSAPGELFQSTHSPKGNGSGQAVSVFGETGAADAASLANRALQALSPQGRGPSAEAGASAEDETAQVWNPEDSAKVPFEVFQRAVAQATAGTAKSTRPAASALEPVFSPPENGGEPFGRAVPFVEEHSGPPYVGTSANEDTESSSELSEGDVEQLLSELTWALGDAKTAERPRTAAA